MRIYFKISSIIILVLTALVGCQTNEDYFGSGPLSLSPRTKAGFARYMDPNINASYFAISEDGGRTGHSWAYCPAGQCVGNEMMLAIRSCETRSKGMSCKIYAEGDNIVWRTNGSKVTNSTPTTSIKSEPTSPPTSNIEERLKALQKLEERSLITKGEAAKKRQAILDSL